MSASDDYARLALDQVKVPEGRQRSDLDLDDDFLSSLRQRGILSPLLVKRDGTLVAGGRRFAAAKHLHFADVPVRFVTDGLTPTELRVIELEENIRRSALPWRDECRAVAELHRLWTATRSGWTYAQSKAQIGHDLSRWLRVAKDLDNPRLAQATSFQSAFNICQRIDAREADEVLEDISYVAEQRENAQTETNVNANGSEGASTRRSADSEPTARAASSSSGVPAAARATHAQTDDVLCTDFVQWASTYAGPRFNFVHCDFPYGKQTFSGEWGGKHDSGFQYEDEPETYWKLIEALCQFRERLFTPSAHLMFWLSSEIEMQHTTIAKFRELAPDFIFQSRALVWLKSDNTGIVPDPKRGPRWVTELALMASRGDRTLVRPLANAYAAPTARALHPSAKPEPVLRHFFGMFVDQTTRLLDPTCGGGSALRAAESLGAAQVLGIEREEQYAIAARKALREFRTLRELAR